MHQIGGAEAAAWVGVARVHLESQVSNKAQATTSKFGRDAAALV